MNNSLFRFCRNQWTFTKERWYEFDSCILKNKQEHQNLIDFISPFLLIEVLF